MQRPRGRSKLGVFLEQPEEPKGLVVVARWVGLFGCYPQNSGEPLVSVARQWGTTFAFCKDPPCHLPRVTSARDA